MGNAIGNASTDVGGFIGKIFTAPLKATIGRSCLNVCSGPWDLACFIEHFCLPDIAKLLLISTLCFIILVFFTLLFKLGICQCIVKSICKMSCAACATYWFAVWEMVSCLWNTLTNTKRVHRRRKRLHDIEAASNDYPSDNESTSTSSSSDSLSHINNIRPKQRKRRLVSKHNHHHRGSNRSLIRLHSRQMSVRIGSKSRRVRSRRKVKSRRVKRVKVMKDVVDYNVSRIP